MAIPHLKNEFMPYPKTFLETWKSGDFSMLSRSNASNYIKEILIHKAKNRTGRRFFGEAYIASSIDMKDGWYNSFKWLTSKKWMSGKALESRFEKPFHNALMKHLGPEILDRLQKKALSFFNEHKEKFFNGKTYKKPVAPDLWLIDKEGGFKFIESKLPGDTLGPHQIAGLALIKKHLKVSVPVSFSIINLYPENINPETLFTEIYELL